jgi:Calx-beta domain
MRTALGFVLASTVAACAGGGAPAALDGTPGRVGAVGDTVREGAVARVVVTRDADAPRRLGWRTVPRSARPGADYRSGWGTLRFAPGERQRTLEIPVLADGRGESDESLLVVLDALPGEPASPGAAALVTIVDR